MFLDLSNLSAITIALPTIQRQFNVDVGDLQWIISAYALTFGGFLLVGGRGGDIFGHRRMLLFGTCFFALFTLVCALSPTFIGLVMARAFQGIGAAFTIPAAQAQLAVQFSDPARKAKALGIWGASGSLGFIIGLILGGVLTDLLGWEWIFWTSLILSAIVIPAAYFILPRPSPERAVNPSPTDPEENSGARRPEKHLFQAVFDSLIRFDALGISLGVPGILLLTYALSSANSVGWSAIQIIVTLIIATLLLLLFVFHERTAPQAVLAPYLFRSLSFNLTLILAVNTYAVRQACTYFLTVQLQSFGNSPIHTSVLFIPLGISALLFNTLAGRLVPVLGARLMFIAGWSLAIPGVLLFSFIDTHTSYWRFTFPGMVLYIAGIGAVYITANFVVVSAASRSDQGTAAGVFNVALQVGGSVLGLAVLTAVAQGVEHRYGDAGRPAGELGHVGYQSVYYSCVVLCVVGLVISVCAIEVPESMRGSVFRLSGSEERSAAEPVDGVELDEHVVDGAVLASTQRQ
ncbi:putative aminotriazole resistance protein [Phyllosticta capitalensis]|uniref:Aminotriazole resistance protein n=1 Tax=Phyllosticta capitalensis TaxID=121624 RepID=A0ABR1YQF4_9PEZI